MPLYGCVRAGVPDEYGDNRKTNATLFATLCRNLSRRIFIGIYSRNQLLNKFCSLLGSLLGSYHTVPVVFEYDPHKTAISIEFWSRQAYTFAFINHCTYSTSPTLVLRPQQCQTFDKIISFLSQTTKSEQILPDYEFFLVSLYPIRARKRCQAKSN